MALASWPAYSDDSGTKTDGTIVDKALLDAIKAAIVADIVSATNPTEVLADIIDEIVNARGSKASVDARLDIALNEDGTLKAIAGQASTADVASQLGADSLVRNSGMTQWSQGAALAPDFYVLAGAGAAVARAGPGESDTTELDVGSFSAKVTSGGGALATLKQTVIPASIFGVREKFQSRKVQFSAAVKTSVGSVARLVIDDGVATSTSSYHTGDGTVQILVATATLSGSATKLDVYLEVAAGTNVAYVSGMQAVVSDVAPTKWAPEPGIWLSRSPVVIARAAKDGAAYYTVTSGAEETAWQLPGNIPANVVSLPGQGFRLRGLITLAANANSKVANLYVGSNSVVLTTATTSATDVYLQFNILVLRSNSTQAIVLGQAKYLVAAGTAGTATAERVGNTITCDWTTAQVLKLTLDGVAASDMVLQWMVVEFLP